MNAFYYFIPLMLNGFISCMLLMLIIISLLKVLIYIDKSILPRKPITISYTVIDKFTQKLKEVMSDDVSKGS